VSDANVVKLLQPGSFADPLTEVLRNGARALLAQAIEAEVAEFLAKHVDLKTVTGLSRVVRLKNDGIDGSSAALNRKADILTGRRQLSVAPRPDQP